MKKIIKSLLAEVPNVLTVLAIFFIGYYLGQKQIVAKYKRIIEKIQLDNKQNWQEVDSMMLDITAWQVCQKFADDFSNHSEIKP